MASSLSETPYQSVAKELPLMIHVIAPSTLPAGYTFEAEINGDPSKLFSCEVPEGGVQEGEMFLVPLPKTYAGNKIEAPTGRWKDGLFNCCGVVYTHPSFWCSWCCGTIAMAQIMSRMQLTWLGEPGPFKQTQKAFSVVLTLTVCYFVFCWSLEFAAIPYATPADEPLYLSYLRMAGSGAFALYSIYALCRTRQTVRTRYQIPETHCQGCEDLCCSIWCNCCVTAQIMRHTGEYETYSGICCSKTGHPPGTPLVV